MTKIQHILTRPKFSKTLFATALAVAGFIPAQTLATTFNTSDYAHGGSLIGHYVRVNTNAPVPGWMATVTMEADKKPIVSDITIYNDSGVLVGENLAGVYLYAVKFATVSDVSVSDITIVNAGTIGGTSGTLYGVWQPNEFNTTLTYTGSKIINSGTVKGDVYALNALNFADISGNEVINAGSGKITGSTWVVHSRDASFYNLTGLALQSTGNRFINAGTATANDVEVVNSLAYSAESAEITDNVAYLSGGTVGNVTAVYFRSASVTDVALKDNKVYISGDVDVAESTITGVKKNTENTGLDLSDSDKVSGNELIFGEGVTVTLNSDGTVNTIENVITPFTGGGKTVGAVAGFNTVTVKAAVWDDPITITRLDALTNTSDEYQTVQIDVSNVAFSGVTELTEGAQTVILYAPTVNGTMELTTTESTYTVGTTLSGTATAAISDNFVLYTIGESTDPDPDPDPDPEPDPDPDPDPEPDPDPVEAQEQTHTVAMTASAVTAALRQAGDTTSVAAYNLTHSHIIGQQYYSAIGGGTSRQHTGSHLTVKSGSISVGVGNNIKTTEGLVSLGVALEGGYGKFKNVFNAGDADPYISKKGHLSFFGGSFVAEYNADSLWHVGAVLRAGRAKSKQANGLYDASTNQTYDFKTSSPYFAAELSAGQGFAVSPTTTIDLFTEYRFLFQKGDSFTVGSSDRYELDDVKSHVARLGSRLTHEFGELSSWNAALGFEYEFDGKAKLKVSNGTTSAYAEPSDVEGGRGFLEIGYQYGNRDSLGWHYGVTLKGKYGKDYRSGWLEGKVRYVF